MFVEFHKSRVYHHINYSLASKNKFENYSGKLFFCATFPLPKKDGLIEAGSTNWRTNVDSGRE